MAADAQPRMTTPEGGEHVRCVLRDVIWRMLLNNTGCIRLRSLSFVLRSAISKLLYDPSLVVLATGGN